MDGDTLLEEFSIWHFLLLGIEYYWPGYVFLASFRSAHERECKGGVVELCESIAISMALSVMVRYASDKYGIAYIDNNVVRILVESTLACIFGAITIYEVNKTREDADGLHKHKTPTSDGAIGPATSDYAVAHDIDPVGKREVMSGMQIDYAVEFFHREQIKRARMDALADLDAEQYA